MKARQGSPSRFQPEHWRPRPDAWLGQAHRAKVARRDPGALRKCELVAAGGELVRYIAITLDGNKYYIDRWYPPAWSGWTGVTVNFQMDTDYAGHGYSTWLDKLTLSYWNSDLGHTNRERQKPVPPPPSNRYFIRPIGDLANRSGALPCHSVLARPIVLQHAHAAPGFIRLPTSWIRQQREQPHPKRKALQLGGCM